MIDYFIDKFEYQHNIDISKNDDALTNLKELVEYAKRELSTNKEDVKIFYKNLINDFDFDEAMSRMKLDELCSDLYDGTLETIKSVLNEAEL